MQEPEKVSELLPAIKVNSIDIVDLSNQKLTPQEVTSLVEVLINNISVTRLNLTCCDIRGESITKLVPALQQNKSIMTLLMGGNGMNEQDVDALLVALEKNYSIIDIALVGSKLTVEQTNKLNVIKQRNRKWREACEKAISEDNCAELAKFLESGISINGKCGEDEETLLHLAARYGRERIFEKLKLHGANPKICNKSQENPEQILERSLKQKQFNDFYLLLQYLSIILNKKIEGEFNRRDLRIIIQLTADDVRKLSREYKAKFDFDESTREIENYDITKLSKIVSAIKQRNCFKLNQLFGGMKFSLQMHEAAHYNSQVNDTVFWDDHPGNEAIVYSMKQPVYTGVFLKTIGVAGKMQLLKSLNSLCKVEIPLTDSISPGASSSSSSSSSGEVSPNLKSLDSLCKVEIFINDPDRLTSMGMQEQSLSEEEQSVLNLEEKLALLKEASSDGVTKVEEGLEQILCKFYGVCAQSKSYLNNEKLREKLDKFRGKLVNYIASEIYAIDRAIFAKIAGKNKEYVMERQNREILTERGIKSLIKDQARLQGELVITVILDGIQQNKLHNKGAAYVFRLYMGVILCLKSLQDFAGMYALSLGLTHRIFNHLELPAQLKKKVAELELLISPTKKFQNLKNAMRDLREDYIPCLVIYSKDLSVLHEANDLGISSKGLTVTHEVNCSGNVGVSDIEEKLIADWLRLRQGGTQSVVFSQYMEKILSTLPKDEDFFAKINFCESMLPNVTSSNLKKGKEEPAPPSPALLSDTDATLFSRGRRHVRVSSVQLPQGSLYKDEKPKDKQKRSLSTGHGHDSAKLKQKSSHGDEKPRGLSLSNGYDE